MILRSRRYTMPSINQLRANALRVGVLLLLLATAHCRGYGQTTSDKLTTVTDTLLVDSLVFDIKRDITTQLVSFDEMYKLALAYSSSVRFEKAVSNSQLSAYELSKLQILQNLTGYVNYSTGNQAILSTGKNVTDNLGQISNGYRAGVNVTVSLHDLFGRPKQISLAKANYEATKERQRTAEIQLKRDLFNLYQDLILAQRVVQIRLRDDQASLAAFRIAEVELQKGTITPEAHAFNSNRYAETRTTVEQAKTTFVKTLFALELVTGVPISKLKRQ